MRKFFYSPSEEPSPQEVETLLEAAKTLEPDLVTIVRLGDEAGIIPRISRFLRWEDYDGHSMLLKLRNGKFTRRRRLSKSIIKYLNELPRSGPFICHRLHAHGNIGNLYKRLWKTVASNVSAHSLSSKWEREHPKELKMEEMHGYLEQLGLEFLTKAQLIAMRLTMEALQRLPPTRRSNRRRFRSEMQDDR